MRTQLQAVSLRIQTVRSNEQMMQSMKGATALLGSMNRQMRLPALQKIAMEFERENDVMDQRQEMMDDAIDDVTGLEDEEEGEEVVKEVLDEIGVDLGQSVSGFPSFLGGVLWVERRKRKRKFSGSPGVAGRPDGQMAEWLAGRLSCGALCKCSSLLTTLPSLARHLLDYRVRLSQKAGWLRL